MGMFQQFCTCGALPLVLYRSTLAIFGFGGGQYYKWTVRSAFEWVQGLPVRHRQLDMEALGGRELSQREPWSARQCGTRLEISKMRVYNFGETIVNLSPSRSHSHLS